MKKIKSIFEQKIEDMPREKLVKVVMALIDDNIKLRPKAEWYDNMQQALIDRGITPPQLTQTK